MKKIFIAAALLLPAGQARGAAAPQDPALAANEIAFKFYAAEAKKPGNIFFSPYSLRSAFAMAYEGAKGRTAKELAALFAFPEKSKDLRAGLAVIKKQLLEAARGAELAQANSFWTRRDRKFLPAYLKALAEGHDGAAMQADFGPKVEETRRGVNAWTENRTRGRIRELFPPGALSPDTSLLLVNTVYFKGRWKNRFDPALTAQADFTTASGQKVKAAMMAAGEPLHAQYAETPELQALRLPYSGDGLAMLVLLPREGFGLARLEAGLNAAKLAAVRKELYNHKVQVSLPRLRLDAGYRLNPALTSLGLAETFTAKADLSGMTGKKNLYIQDAFHRAMAEVSEEGTEAAAATALAAVPTSSIVQDYAVFKADRPFVFLIEDPRSGLILFMGRADNPAAR